MAPSADRTCLFPEQRDECYHFGFRRFVLTGGGREVALDCLGKRSNRGSDEWEREREKTERMIDQAQMRMAEGVPIALEQISGVNDNMSKSHFHPYFELYFMDAGSRYHMMDDALYQTKSGDCMIFSPYTMHHSFSDKDVTFSRVVIYFRPDQIHYPGLLAKLNVGSGLYRPDPHTLTRLRRMIYVMMEYQNREAEDRDDYLNAMLNGLLFEIIHLHQIREDKSDENRINGVIRYIHLNYWREIKLPELAGRFYVSEYYLCREFKRYTNRTIGDYIRGTRIMNAQRLFMETNENVTGVAHRTGFSSLTHFNRVFKEVTGMTPSEYRRECRQREEERR